MPGWIQIANRYRYRGLESPLAGANRAPALTDPPWIPGYQLVRDVSYTDPYRRAFTVATLGPLFFENCTLRSICLRSTSVSEVIAWVRARKFARSCARADATDRHNTRVTVTAYARQGSWQPQEARASSALETSCDGPRVQTFNQLMVSML